MDLAPGAASSSLSDSDLALVDAVQDDPRAPWARLGAQLGISAPTARRRWERLRGSDSAWITTHAGWRSGVVTALIAVQCRPGTSDAIARTLVGHPRVMTIAHTTGDHDLLLTVMVPDILELRRLMQSGLTSHDGVVRMRSMLVTRMFRDGSHWRSGSLGSTTCSATSTDGPLRFPTPALRAAIGVLERDGRAPSSALAATLGVSEPHARRFVRRAIRSGHIVQRVDVRLDQPHWPHSLVLWMVVPAARLHETADRISQLPLARACASLAGGGANLYTVVWLRSLAEAPDVEARIVRGLDVRVTERSILLHYGKRMGHVFDDRHRRTGHVPWASP
ncbi:Lrp/AsnC family transcriptional regulator [Microbacterium betulae]|uniref:Lrp/AsnC family transcriptional regulator n=1 Tax=Microbacterium betulae TaxID=2981139 RepID=A0AA97FMC0_9MICO|nr:Lrp/AsnC family transcriptional regulator [Microbacterium sp. AB]WOF24052.1 Lrp/AsnC family transcriptional regulator [Microbacterium sp. AB]